MYCAHCGLQAAGNFCSGCGEKLVAGGLSPIDWRQETRYQRLLQVAEVRERIARSVSAATKQISGEQFLELAEQAFEPLLNGVPVGKLAAIVQPLYAQWGISTGKNRSLLLQQPIGEVLVDIVCSLASAGQTIKQVHQADAGCVLDAEIPSDWRSFAGQLIVSIRREEEWTIVDASAKIPGQIFDYGKSQQTLERLFGDVQKTRAAA